MKRGRVLFIQLSQFRVFIRKCVIAALFVSALALMIFSKADTVILNKTADMAAVIFVPVVRVMQLPAQAVFAGYEKIRDIVLVYRENERLKKENLDLLMLRNEVRTLKVENKLLGSLLNYTPPPGALYLTAKVVAEEGDGFSHSLIVYTGKGNQVQRGQVVLGDRGVVGRVDSVNDNYVRIILVTDINSKIPVIVERSRARGILSGDNTTKPKLLFVSPGTDIKAGDVLVTSGVAGVFPPGLPVAVVKSVDREEIVTEVATDVERLEYVRIVDYGIYDGVVKLSGGEKGK